MTCRKFLFLAVLTGLAMAGPAPPARADFEVQFSYGGAAITIDVTTQTASATGGASLAGATIHYNSASKVTITGLTVDPNAGTDGNSGGFTINASVSTTNSPGLPTIATISTSGLGIMNQTGVNGNSTLTITTGSTGFAAPATNPVILTSTASVSADGTNGANASLVFNSYLNANNSQFGTGPPGAPTITLSPVAPGASASGNTSATVPLTATPYSIVQVGQYTLGNGDDFFDGSTGTNVMPTPAPTGLVLALSAMPVLCFGAWLRRRHLAVAL